MLRFASVDPDPFWIIERNVHRLNGRKVEFPVDGFSKHCLLEGIDELGYIQQQEASIQAFEAQRVGSLNTLA